MANQPTSLCEQGKHGRDFVHIHDVAKANLLALENSTDFPSVFNIGSDNYDTIKEIANALAKACQKDVEMLALGEFRQGDVYSCYANLTQSGHEFNFSPSVSLEKGMEEFVQWASRQESIDG